MKTHLSLQTSQLSSSSGSTPPLPPKLAPETSSGVAWNDYSEGFDLTSGVPYRHETSKDDITKLMVPSTIPNCHKIGGGLVIAAQACKYLKCDLSKCFKSSYMGVSSTTVVEDADA